MWFLKALQWLWHKLTNRCDNGGIWHNFRTYQMAGRVACRQCGMVEDRRTGERWYVDPNTL